MVFGLGSSQVIVTLVYLVVRSVLGLLVVLFRRDLSKDAELMVLRHQNAVLRRHIGRVWSRPRRCWPGTASWPRRSTTRVSDASPADPGSPEHRPPCRSPGDGESALGIPSHPR